MESESASILEWLNSFPEKSISRLKRINNAANTANHIVLAVAYGLGDASIRSINRLIIGLMLSRMKAERSGQQKTVERINAFLEILHKSIDSVTEVTRIEDGGITVPCRSVVRRKNA